MTDQHDRMVGEYLDAVRRATVDLPPDRRDDLLADLSEHIATARAELDPETEAGVRDILERLGDPASIAAEARLGAPPSAAASTGPVAPVKGFDDEDEAIAAANDTEFGLVAYVYTSNLKRALRVIERLDTGMVGLNQGMVSNPAAPFGGIKQSGFGREGGYEGIEEYLETKYVAMNL